MAFKTMEWIRSVRDKNYEATKGMSFEQRKAYIRKRAAAAERKARRLAKK